MVKLEITNESEDKIEVKLFTEKEAIEEAERKRCIVAYYA